MGIRHFSILSVLCALVLSAGVSAQIRLVLTPSRSSGVAPLAVFFDASASTGLSGGRFSLAHFTWDFGDTPAGSWATTGKTKNSATGFLCAHVFERPGTFSVTVNVRDGDGTAASSPARVSITVSDPEAVYAGINTRCVSQTGDFNGAPPGAQQVTSDDFASQIAWINGAANRRLLFRSGETWSGVTTAFTGNGPHTIGAFGPGAKPKFVVALNEPQTCGFLAGGSDWRLMDMEWDGSNLPSGGDGSGVSGFSGTEVLGLRLDIHNAGSTGWGGGGDYNYLCDCAIHDNGYFSVYVDGVGQAIMGSNIDQMRVATSFLRPAASQNMYVAHNLVDASRSAPTTGIKWHSRRGVITDNIITAGTSRISSGESGDGWDHPVNRNLGIVLIERNVLKPGNNPANDQYTSEGIGLHNADMVVRNNLLYDMNCAFDVDSFGRQASVYNNTCYMTDSTKGLNVGNGDFINCPDAMFGCEVRNNIMMSLNRGLNGDAMLCHFPSTAGLDMSHNVYYKPSRTAWYAVGDEQYTLSRWQALGMDSGSVNADPQLSSVDPANPSFFLLKSGSPAVGAGTRVPVFEDFNRNPRPLTGAQDAGAFIFGSARVTGKSSEARAEAGVRPRSAFYLVNIIDRRPMSVGHADRRALRIFNVQGSVVGRLAGVQPGSSRVWTAGGRPLPEGVYLIAR